MLRYPGGKLRLMKKINALIFERYKESYYSNWAVCEPFTGGGGSLINMAKDFPHWKFHINDLNPEIASMWKFFYSAGSTQYADLYGRIREQKATLAEYNRIFGDIPRSHLEKTFRIIFLNKTSFSGFVTKNRPIGGAAQEGKWKVDVYWHPETVIKGIERMRGLLKNRILSVSCLDFEKFLIDKEHEFVYADPPYIAFGKDWYGCPFDMTDLRRLQNIIKLSKKWCLSIDKSEEIEELFGDSNKLYLDVKHTAKSSYKSSKEDNKITSAKELVIFPLT